MSADLQAQVQAAIDGLVASGNEIGLQVAVLHRGQLIVDAVAGVADELARFTRSPASRPRWTCG